jgi:single-stranded-DNA-specific exonuclease
MAAGLTLDAASYEGFAKAFEDATRASCDRALFARTVQTDGPLKADEIALPLINALDEHVWGQGFPPPLFSNVFTVLEQRLLKDRHLKLSLDLDGRRFNAIWFRRTELLPKEVRLAYRPVADDYNGMRRVQLVIEHAGQA